MSSGRIGGPAGRGIATRVAVLLLAGVGVVAWVFTMRAAARTLSFEPNATGAIQTSAGALTPALGWGLVLVAAAVALAVLTGKRRLALLGGPGLVVAVFVLVAPRANGARS